MLRAAAKLAEVRPGVRFAVACVHERHRSLMREIVAAEGDVPNLVLHSARTPELIRLADVSWAVSGSVGLELMVEALPTIVLYKVRPFDLWVARKFIRSKYISLVNLLADAEVMPEFLTSEDVSGDLAAWADRLLGDPAARAEASGRLAALRDQVAVPGASELAAARIVDVLESLPRARGHLPSPHAHVRSVVHRDVKD